MRVLDRLKDWMYPPPSPTPAPPSPPAPKGEGPWAALATVVDPEFGLDIVSMGLVREVSVDGDRCRVPMTLTTRGCPVGPLLVEEVGRALRAQGLESEVELEFDPPWSPEDMDPAARARLGR